MKQSQQNPRPISMQTTCMVGRFANLFFWRFLVNDKFWPWKLAKIPFILECPKERHNDYPVVPERLIINGVAESRDKLRSSTCCSKVKLTLNHHLKQFVRVYLFKFSEV